MKTVLTAVFAAACGLAFLASAGCAPEALPREKPEKEFGNSLVRAERAAGQAAKSANDAARQLEQSQKLLQEARSLTVRAEAAEARCSTYVADLAEAERARQKALRAKAAKQAKAPEVQPTVAATPEPEKTKEPEYAPSDAP